MTQKTHKIIFALLNLIVLLGALEALIKIINLNQIQIYFGTAYYISLFFLLQIVFLYDLHFKIPGSFNRAVLKHQNIPHWFLKAFKIFFSALHGRLCHFVEIKFWKYWVNYLILPGIIFWSTVSIFFINLGNVKLQQIFAMLSGAALFVNYIYLKEIFSRKKEIVDPDIFAVMSVVKIYASALAYGVAVALIRRDCQSEIYLISGSFFLTILMISQALFQHKLVNFKNLCISLLISMVMAILSWLVLVFWGYNYFTAGIALAAAYNLMWAIFHYYLDRALSWRALWEILIISAIIASMVFSVTNFKAKLLDGCQYKLQITTNNYKCKKFDS